MDDDLEFLVLASDGLWDVMPNAVSPTHYSEIDGAVLLFMLLSESISLICVFNYLPHSVAIDYTLPREETFVIKDARLLQQIFAYSFV